MLAKLIVWAPTRLDAIERMHRALLELTIEGVETSRDFHLRVMEDAEFRRGDITIQWLEQRLPSLLGPPSSPERIRIAAIAGALLAEQDRLRRSGRSPATPGTSPAEGGARALRHADNIVAWRRAARLESLRPA
jgi:acetyl-CoA carboxylase biotin carboxylase subunit